MKITYQNYLFELNFKTDYCLGMTVTDVFDGRRYQNNNIQFFKIQKVSILTALQDTKQKQIKCQISQESIQRLQEKQINKPVNSERCLRIKFTVSLEYIQSFQQVATLYEIESIKKLQNIVAKKLTKQAAKQFKKQIQQIQQALPKQDQLGKDQFQYYDVGTINLQQNKAQQDRVVIIFISYNIVVIIMWIAHFTFLQSLGLSAISIALIFLYWGRQRHLIKQFDIGKGTFKVQVTGMLTVQNYSQNPRDSLVLHAQFNEWTSKKIRIYINSMNYYSYPFNGALLIKSNKDQSLSIKIQKNAKLYPVSVQNVLITVQKLSSLTLVE